MVHQHRLAQVIKERRVQWARGWPATVDVVCGAGIVFKFPDRCFPRKRLGDVGEVSLDTSDTVSLVVYFVNLVAGVVACQWRNGGTDVAHLEGFGEVDVSCVTKATAIGETCGGVIVEYLKHVRTCAL